MRVKLNTLILMLVFSMQAFSQEDTSSANSDEGKTQALLELKMGANDTMYVATAMLTNAETKQPLKDVEVIFSVPRMFGQMEIGNATTDTTGTASIEFPFDIRANDKKGLFAVVAKVEDNDNIKNVSAQAQVRSKLAFPADKPVPRAIMGSRAPWWLVASFWGSVGSIWGLFLYSLFLAYKIKKSKNHLLTTN